MTQCHARTGLLRRRNCPHTTPCPTHQPYAYAAAARIREETQRQMHDAVQANLNNAILPTLTDTTPMPAVVDHTPAPHHHAPAHEYGHTHSHNTGHHDSGGHHSTYDHGTSSSSYDTGSSSSYDSGSSGGDCGGGY